MERRAVIVSAARTPFGTFGGGLRQYSATQLGSLAAKEAWGRAGQPEVDYAYFGQVVQAGSGQIPSRQVTLGAGLPEAVPSDTINKVCASALRAVNLAEQAIRVGDAQVVLAGGMESMSQAPYLLPAARWGQRMGNGQLIDSVIHDGLWCSFGNCHMGLYGAQGAKEYGITREAQDEWALRSHQRALAAWAAGFFADEVFAVGEVSQDEPMRPDTSLERLAKLRPVFDPAGTITAGNAPGLSDGAAALVIMEAQEAERRGLEPLAEIVSSGQASEAAGNLHTVPARAGQRALAKAGLAPSDLARVEINEAFAAVTLVSMQLLGVSADVVNVNGGALALGHPIGATGARLLMTLIYELRRRGGGYGLATLCSGGGQGEATVIRVG